MCFLRALPQEKLPLCGVLLPRPAQSSRVFPVSTLSSGVMKLRAVVGT